MNHQHSQWGDFFIGSREDIFEKLLAMVQNTLIESHSQPIIGMSGGSTPKAFYEWIVQQKALNHPEQFLWTTSDERCVSLDDKDSNCGLLKNTLLDPLNTQMGAFLPWPVGHAPEEAAKFFENQWVERFKDRGFDLCVLGIGEDGHTASLFPHCPLIGKSTGHRFAAVNWPGRGWRLTSTEHMFHLSSKIVILGMGATKAKILKTVLNGPMDPMEYPIQVLKPFSQKLVWLLEENAAADLIF